MTKWTDRPVFLSGMSQSGTTLLQGLLDGHSQMLMFPTEPTIPIMLRQRSGYKNMKHLLIDWLYGVPGNMEFCREVTKLDYFPTDYKFTYYPLPANFDVKPEDRKQIAETTVFSGFDKDVQREVVNIEQWVESLYLRVETKEITSERELIDEAVQSLKESSIYKDRALKRWLFKEPSIINTLEGLERFFSYYIEGQSVIIVRDPRAFYQSFKDIVAKKGKTPTGWFKRFAFLAKNIFVHLKSNYWLIQSELRPLFKDKIHIVRYEDLVLNTENEVRTICDFIDIPFEKILTRPTKFGKSTDVITSTSKTKRKVFSHSIDRWQNSLSRLEVVLIETAAEDFMLGHKYKMTTSPIVRKILKRLTRPIEAWAAMRFGGNRTIAMDSPHISKKRYLDRLND